MYIFFILLDFNTTIIHLYHEFHRHLWYAELLINKLNYI